MKALLRQCRFVFSNVSGLQRYSQKLTEDSPYKNIKVEKMSKITTISIDRPSTRNSLDIATLTELVRAVQQFELDNDARMLVLAGEGGNLSSGFDLTEVKEKGYDALRDAARPLLRRPFTSKPSVCAVEGFAVAEGLELALACDLRVIEDTAVLGFLGRRFGATQSIDGGARLAGLVGLSRALDLTITGRLISGNLADTWGLAARLVATGTGIGQAINLATSVVKFPPAAVQVDKLAMYNSLLDTSSDEFARNEAVILGLQGRIAQDVLKGAEKFEKEIGRHGKSYGLSPYENIKSWEKERDDDSR